VGIVEGRSPGRPAYAPPRRISPDDRLDSFDCGKPALNDFLRHRALNNEGKASRSYVVVAAGEIAAYYTLSAGAVQLDQVPGKLKRNMPNPLPVIVLGRMAVDLRHAKKGLGKALLKEAMKRVLEASRAVGARALIVHAIDDDAVSFYTQYDFQVFPADSRTLFLPIETLEASL
jgi:GNAT superfamily N-acetyltransferase